jgi:hypothetical protein
MTVDRYEPLPQGFCEECGEFCEGRMTDVGIGPHEFWGSTGNQVDIRILSPCCEAEINENEPESEDE